MEEVKHVSRDHFPHLEQLAKEDEKKHDYHAEAKEHAAAVRADDVPVGERAKKELAKDEVSDAKRDAFKVSGEKGAEKIQQEADERDAIEDEKSKRDKD